MRRRIFFEHILPFALALSIVALVFIVSGFILPKENGVDLEISSSILKGNSAESSGHLANLTEKDSDEVVFASSLARKDQITILGSSELATSKYNPDQFMYHDLGIPAYSFGHAHHQSFAMFCELLANKEYLEGSKICIFLSPGWFKTKGTNPEAFVEFVRPNFLKRIIADQSIDQQDKLAIGEYIHRNKKTFSGLTAEMFYLEQLYLLSDAIYISDVFQSYFQNHLFKSLNDRGYFDYQTYDFELNESESKEKNINLDSIGRALQREFLDQITNNDLYVYDEYYAEYLLNDGEYSRGRFRIDHNTKRNLELTEFRYLLNLVKTYNVDASFVIFPLNPYHYEELEKFNPYLDILLSEIEDAGFPCYNMYVSEEEDYDKGVLKDVMHPGEYGWIGINQFLKEVYGNE